MTLVELRNGPRHAVLMLGLPLVLLALIVLAACGRPSAQPSRPAPSTPTAAPSTTPPNGTEADHELCGRLGAAADEFDFSVDTNQALAREAMASSTPTIVQAGRMLQTATETMFQGEPDKVTIGKAQITFAATCSALFGDGNW